MGLTFKEVFGKEIFMTCGEVDDSEPIFVTETWDELKIHLRKNFAYNMAPPRVLHGVLTTAIFLPKSLMGRPVNLICSEDNFETGYVIELSAGTVAELADEIESAIEGELTGEGQPGIEDIFLFYGYEIPIHYTVSEEAVDDEIIHTCMGIANSAKEAEEVAVQALQ